MTHCCLADIGDNWDQIAECERSHYKATSHSMYITVGRSKVHELLVEIYLYLCDLLINHV